MSHQIAVSRLFRFRQRRISVNARSPAATSWLWRLIQRNAVEQFVELTFAQRDALAIRRRHFGRTKHMPIQSLVTQDEMLALRS
jgi:hypothetical protein